MTTAANRHRAQARQRTPTQYTEPATPPEADDGLGCARACIYAIPACLLVWAALAAIYLLATGTPLAPTP